MNYEEYCDKIKDVPASCGLEYGLAVIWLHPERLPLCLLSASKCETPVVRVPAQIKNNRGYTVPVVAIWRDAFAGNKNVTDIILPSGIEGLPAGAFSGCSSLKNITIPKNVRMIKEKTFEGCASLENVFYEGTEEEWSGIEISRENDQSGSAPGNEALFRANICFGCKLEKPDKPYSFRIMTGGKDITGAFRTDRIAR